jgi:hypothetical protein
MMPLRRVLEIFVVLAVFAGTAPVSAQTYRFKLQSGKRTPVCEHMAKVYSTSFRKPWDFTLLSPPGPLYPPVPGAKDLKYTASQRVGLYLSRYPSSPEFEAIHWQIGRLLDDSPLAKSTNPVSPMLVARFDIDNDGKEDVVVKAGFMLSPEPAGQGAPGGEDWLYVLNESQFARDRPMRFSELFNYAGSARPSLIASLTLHMLARGIRPFIYDGQTYLSVYQVKSFFDEKRRTEQMWVMKYRGGGENLGGGNWRPLNVEKICRFRMFASYR